MNGTAERVYSATHEVLDGAEEVAEVVASACCCCAVIVEAAVAATSLRLIH